MRLYPITLKKTNDSYYVNVPTYDVATQGKDIEESIYMAKDLIKLMEEDYIYDNKELPKSDFTSMLNIYNEDLIYLIV